MKITQILNSLYGEIPNYIINFFCLNMNRIEIHPQYNSRGEHNDFALLKLEDKIDFESYAHIRPICMPKDKPTPGSKVSIDENLSMTFDLSNKRYFA